MYTIDRIVAENFLSYPQIDLDFSGKSTILIQAESPQESEVGMSNGFGKSTIAEIISYGMYSKLLRSQGSRIAPAQIIREGTDRLSVTVYLSDAKHHTLVITRTLDLEGKKTVELIIDGKKRKLDKKTDVSHALSQHLGIDFDMLMHRFLTPENTSFISLAPSDRFRIVASLLTFNWDKVWSEMANKTKAYKSEIDNIRDEIKDIKIEEAQWQGKYELLTSQESVRDTKLTQLQSRVDALVTKLVPLQDSIVGYETKISEADTVLREKQDEKSKASNLIIKFKERMKRLRSEDPWEAIRVRFDKLGKLTCTNCHTELNTESLIDQLASERKKEISIELLEVEEALALANRAFHDIEEVYNALYQQKEVLDNNYEEIDSEIKIYKSEINVLLKEKKSLQKENPSIHTQGLTVDLVEQKKKDICDRILDLSSKLMERESMYSVCQYIKTASQVSSPARLSSVIRLLSPLEKGISRVISHLFNREINVSFQILDKQLDIVSPELHIPTMSTGERRSFDIAMACTIQDLALQSSRNQIGFFIGDELFDGLDEKRIQAAVNLIRSLPIPQIILITHSSQAKSLVEILPDINILRVTNDHGISRASFIDTSIAVERTDNIIIGAEIHEAD